jgi:mannan endo-1,4-beta-mannosidase
MRTRLLGLFIVAISCLPVLVAAQQETTMPDITLPSYQGYISVAPDGRYFVDETGKGFLVIGENDGVPWPGLSTLLNRLSPEATEAYVSDLRAHGITVSRVMIEYTQDPHTYLENPVGTFSPAMVQFWDDFIALAEKHGLYLLLTPYDTFWQATNWDKYPYSAAMGGPCQYKGDWLTGADCIEAQKNRWRFIIDHWGNSPNVFAWDLMNEVDIWWDATDTEIEAYVDQMATFVRDLETQRWGRAHMLTVSSAASTPDGVLARVIFRDPNLDFANTHLYIGPAIKDPSDPIGAGPLMSGGVSLALDAIRDHRPYFDSESGPIDHWITDVNFDKEYHHNMSWAHLAAGGAGSGMRWPYSTPHWLLPELRDNLLGLARFASTIDWAHFPSENITNKVLVDRQHILKAACSDGHTAIVWLLRDTQQDATVVLPGAQVTIRGVLEDSGYNVEFWETYGGNPLQTVAAQSQDGSLTVTIPDLGVDLKDVVLLIRSA